MTKKQFLLGSLLAVATFFGSCTPEPEITNEQEVITTLTYTLTPNGGGTAVVLTFQDLDGDGGNLPTIVGGTLDTNTTYTGAMILLNETESPAEDVTLEIADEALEHQFFFTNTVAGMTVAYADTDTNGNPIGLATTITTGATGSGNLTVLLKHEPDKTATGVSGGDATNAGGETDIEVTFPISVQ